MSEIILIGIIGYLLLGYFATQFGVVPWAYQLIWPLGILMILFNTGCIRIGSLKMKLQWPITFR